MSNLTYPVHVGARLDTHLSRWLWLVKWVLVIPHYLALAFLWLAFVLLSAVAFVAILATGRYPQAIFDFNVGVLRWTWRVTYYAYGALGTDRYPPFTLAEVPDYPATLTIDYPDHLSRGLVLVKWWLLALPHYVLVGLFLGGGWMMATRDDDAWVWSGGVIGLLVLVAAVVLTVTGRYPRSVFDLVLGLNRWVLRVAAYAGLMTDAYPPFRLDMGGTDPDGHRLVMGPQAPAETDPVHAAPARSAAPATEVPRNSTWTAGRIVAVVVASLFALPALGLVAGGGAMLVADQALRDDAGFVMSGEETVTADAYAITSPEVRTDPETPGFVPDRLVGDLTVTAAGDGPVFLGVAEAADVEQYLAGVKVAALDRFGAVGADPEYDISGAAAPASVPAAQGFWADSATGTGTQQVVVPFDGDWVFVLMNPDGTAGVTADVEVGAELPVLGWGGAVLLSLGLTGLVVTGIVLAVVLRRAGKV